MTTFKESEKRKTFVVFWQKLTWYVGHFAWQGFFKMHLPNKKVFNHRPLLIVANHQSISDPWAILLPMPLGLYKRLIPIRFLASREPNHAILRRIYKFIIKPLIYIPNGVIELPPRRHDGVLSLEDKTRSTIDRLQAGEVVIVFPEGHANYQSKVSPFKRGAPYIARQTGAPILPVAIDWEKRIVRWSPEVVRIPASLNEEEASAWLHGKVDALFKEGRA